jgi:hypothetical protein
MPHTAARLFSNGANWQPANCQKALTIKHLLSSPLAYKGKR